MEDEPNAKTKPAPNLTLRVFGPAFGQPDPSTFCLKGLVLLKMSGLPFAVETGDVTKAPKKKFPVLYDNGRPIPDTTLIRFHLETHYGIDFDQGLTETQRGLAWALEKLCEDNLYWAIMHERWALEENFERGPREFFASVPAPMRPLVVALVKREVKRNLHGHGLGRHSRDELMTIARRGVDAVAQALGDNDWIMGETPCGADASVWATIYSLCCDRFRSPLTDYVANDARLTAYSQRGLAHWFPDFNPS